MIRYFITGDVELTEEQLRLLIEIERATIHLRALCSRYRELGTKTR
jgi:hypothetical protein